jgi:hypothetical protein
VRRQRTTTVATGQPVASATAAPIPVVTELSTAGSAHEPDARRDTAARQQPQPSGGGAPHHKPRGLTAREQHGRSEPGRPDGPGSASESHGHAGKPPGNHSNRDDHPGADDHPGGGPPDDKPQPPVPPGPPVDPGPPDVKPPVDAPGKSPVDVPGKPPDSPGKPHDLVPPIKKP